MKISNFIPTVIQLLSEIPEDCTDAKLEIYNKGYNSSSTIYHNPMVVLKYTNREGEIDGRIILLDDNYSLNILNRK